MNKLGNFAGGEATMYELKALGNANRFSGKATTSEGRVLTK